MGDVISEYEMGEVIAFPVLCNQCGEEIQDGELYYDHPELRIICEYCPAFKDGGVEPDGGTE